MDQLYYMRQNPSFTKIWIGAALSFFAERMFAVGMPIWIYQATESPQLVVAGSLAQTVATFVFSLLGGVLVDRLPKSRLLVWSSLVAATLFIPALVWVGPSMNIWLIITFIFMLTSVMRVISISRVAAISFVVPQHQLIKANSAVGTVHSLSLMLGPVLGSFGLVLGGYRGILAFCLVAYILVGLVSSWIRVEQPLLDKKYTRDLIADFRDGLVVVSRNRVLWGGILFLATFMIAGSAFGSIIYLYVKNELHASDSVFALAMTLQGVGNVVGSFCITSVTKRWSLPVAVSSLVAVIAVLELSYLIVAKSALMLAVAPIVGVATQIAMVISTTHYQKSCKLDYVGRAIGFRQMISSLFSIISTTLAVLLVNYVSVRTILIGSTMILALASPLGYLFVREAGGSEESLSEAL